MEVLLSHDGNNHMLIDKMAESGSPKYTVQVCYLIMEVLLSHDGNNHMPVTDALYEV